MYFEELDESMIQAYVATGEWQGEAGGYKVRTGAGASLISRNGNDAIRLHQFWQYFR